MNILKRILNKTVCILRIPFDKFAQRRHIKILSSVSSVFGTLKKAERNGLLRWNPRQQRLFIAEPLATVQLAMGADRWATFLNNVYLYNFYNRQSNAWQKLINDRTTRAVQEEKKTNPHLTHADLDRIRRNVQANLVETDVPVPKLQPHEFYIIGDDSQITLCGTYDPDTDLFDIVAWEDIKTALAAKKD